MRCLLYVTLLVVFLTFICVKKCESKKREPPIPIPEEFQGACKKKVNDGKARCNGLCGWLYSGPENPQTESESQYTVGRCRLRKCTCKINPVYKKYLGRFDRLKTCLIKSTCRRLVSKIAHRIMQREQLAGMQLLPEQVNGNTGSNYAQPNGYPPPEYPPPGKHMGHPPTGSDPLYRPDHER